MADSIEVTCSKKSEPKKPTWKSRFEHSLPWLIPTLVGILLSVIGGCKYKSIKNYDYAFEYCQEKLTETAKSLTEISKSEENKKPVLKKKGTKTILKSIRNDSPPEKTLPLFEAAIRKAKIAATPTEQNEVKRLAAMLASSNPSMMSDFNKFMKLDLSYALSAYKAEVQQSTNKRRTAADSTELKKYLNRSLLDQLNLHARMPIKKTNVLHLDHLKFIKECVKNTHDLLD